jgi:hypothetical protein
MASAGPFRPFVPIKNGFRPWQKGLCPSAWKFRTNGTYLWYKYFVTIKTQKIMKKVQNKKLTLGKMAVAKLNQRHMRFFYGGIDTVNVGNDTKGTVQPDFDATTSFVNDPNNPCGTIKPPIKTKAD